MAISEHDRYELHKWLIDHAGEQVAETMMAHLPPTGWADVATKRDLELLAATLRGEMHELRGEMHLMRADFNEKLRGHLTVIVGLNISLAGAVVAFLR
ncbi:hypothetical protein NHL50_09570 [Acidimicrobiia bacterium EGI L10123]|uniref:hypothetical protein n=1 Tax=Salinilacustrithrix flava TaxID=2957203 RepID=UPI003D7C2788|nr:hypothetical protein [Acidimicrobiia bacterium EGI L10123]